MNHTIDCIMIVWGTHYLKVTYYKNWNRECLNKQFVLNVKKPLLGKTYHVERYSKQYNLNSYKFRFLGYLVFLAL